MPTTHAVKPTQKPVKRYYEALAAYAQQDVDHELAVRSAFQNLLDETGRRSGWTRIPELSDIRILAEVVGGRKTSVIVRGLL